MEADNLKEFVSDLDEVLNFLGSMLIKKNTAYGDSALNPCRIFSNSDIAEQLNVRIDDKISRIANGDESEDSELDLIGYLILKRIHTLREDRALDDIKSEAKGSI